ncbi:hypothetical protein, conserved [Leishmania donovani]|uniref:C2 domain-containing protein n=1 Tax=Leishmania donovani TaxID=5661 RepID=E9BBD9_LEIDO|nr:hypothetical protein, conserved [Leishmania donovani]CBZ32564.1 hypothetical protein, conserved [Leishmania donovani]
MATLKVTVHEARDLPIMDRATGLADPYVVVKLDDMEHTTDIAHLTRNPVWEHDVRFDTADLLVLQEDPLEIRVYDHDIISRDDIVGMVLLDCNSIIYRANPVVSGWFPLLDSGAGLHGDIRLTIRIKFHAAENPLAPALPERYVRRLDPRVAERLSSLAAAIPGGNGGHVQHANSNPRTNETSVSFSMVTSATGLNAATTQSSCVAPISSSGNHVASSEHSPRGLINEPCRISASGVNVNKKNVSVGLSTAGAGHHHHHHRRHRSTSRKLTGARRLSKAPWHAPSHSGGGGTFEAGTDVPSLAGASFSLANNNVSASTMSSSANFARYDPSVLFAGPSGATTTEAAVAMAAAAAVENSAMPLPLPSPTLFPFLVEQDLDPLRAARVDHPTLAAEEEGIFVFSVWRLDPAVFRVESTHSMMEELIVKADPEHVRFTNLRSSRSINDARVIQLFKLSGKVRRQLARKVVELQCNAVLGYVEEFDMEPNGIIVRAYGTPCVVSHVKYVDQREMEALLRGKSRYIRSSMMAAYQEEFPGASMAAAPPRSHSPALPSYGLSPILSNGGVGGNVGGTSTPATPSGPTQSADLIALGNTMAALPLHLPTTNASSTPMAAHDHLLPPSMSACSSQLGTSAQQRQSDHAVAAASWASTPLSSKEAVAPTAVQSPRSTPETYASAMETGDRVDSSGVPLLSLDNGGGRAGLSAAAPASALAGALSANSTTHHHSQAALTLAKNAQCSSPPFSRSFVAPSVDATVPMLPDALVQQQPSHANLMMRSGPTDTAVATVAATPATAPPMTNALIAASGAAAGGGPPARVIISMLTVKDLPAGSIHHIGGYICARSVKIVSRVKSRQIISQERDAWWMELREELRANARAFHCNTVLGYEEETQYHEDVVLLSLYGTAVMLNMSAASLRAGPEHLFSWQKQRVASKRNCALLHLYEGSRRKGGLGFLAGEVGDLLMHHVCSICHNKPVPDVLLAACTLPVELNCETPPRLVQVAVSKPKANVKGVELAMAVSQALPFIEFALHKQLLFNLRLQQLNACFSLRVSIVVGHDAIIGMLTGSGCRLAGLPVPRLPRVTVVDQQIAHKESVVKLRDVIASRRRRRNTAHSSSSRSTSSSSSSSSCSSRPAAAAQSSAMPGADGAVPAPAVAAAGLRGGGSRDNVRGIGSTGTKASSAAFTVRSLSTSSTSHTDSSSSSSFKRCKRHRRRRRRHRARGKRGRGNRGSSSPSRGPSRSPSEADALPSTTSGIESLHSSQSRDAAAAPAQKWRRHRRTRHASACASAVAAAGAAAAGASRRAGATPGSPSRGATLPKSRSSSPSTVTSSSRPYSSSRSSSSSSSTSSRTLSTSPSKVSLHSWVLTESSMTDEDVYAPADEWRTTSGGVRTKARDYVVKIDDVEEADMMLGMVDTTNFEDGVLLTLPYVPDSANAFDWQERIVLYRRYSRASALPFGGGGGTGAAALMGSVNMSGGLSSYGATRSRSVLGASVMGSSGAYQNCSDPASAAAGGGDGMNAGGGAAAAGRMALTTRLLNEYCADAKRAFVHRACRMAMRTGQPLRLRVVNLRVEMMFVPNSADLQLRLEGCVMVASSAGARQLRQLEDRAFRVCMHYTMESLSGLQQYQQQQQQYPSQASQSNHGGGSAAGQRAAGATPIMAVNAVASGKASPYLRWKPNTPVLSPLMVDAASNNLVTTSLGGPAAAAAAAVQTASSQNPALPSMPQPLAAYAANSMCGMLAMSSVLATVDSGPAYIDARRLFTTSNAPFSIPYVQDITVPPPRVWSGVATAVSEDTAAPVRHTSTYAEYRDSRGSRTNSLTRRWNAFVRATGQSIKSLVDRATGGGTGDRRMQQQQRQWLSSSIVSDASVRAGEENGRSLTSVGGAAGGPSSMTAAARDANYCNPAARLPKDISQLQMFIPVVLFTPLDYVAGRSIVRYLGRLSQHFIREDYDTDTGDGLNMFFQRAETEIVCVVQALVRLMGGNALLKHRIVYHEICDSDGSGRAFLFATVTGDVVQVSDTVYWGKHAQPQRQQKDGSARKNEKEVATGDFSDDGDSDGAGSRKE